MTRAKICGITREADLEAAVTAGTDAIGVTAEVTVDTPREVPVELAAALAAATPPFVTAVLVTMPDSVEEAVEVVERVQPDAVQLHGDLDADDVARVADRTGVGTIAAVDAAAPDEELAAHASAADALLVDSVDDQGGGGTGETHDWERSRSVVDRLDVPVVLAGGLTPDNVAEAVRTVDPFAVDVASGVERSGGVKDHDAVAAFVERATRAQVEV
jgi:phosphoribosylanthranilate isomerase